MIENKIKDRTASVVLVDSSGAVRQLLSEVAKSLGFQNATAVATVADAHALLETEQVDWLIIPLATAEEINAMHTLRIGINFTEVRGLKISLLLEENELWCLPRAFEWGLFSYHMKPFTKNSLKKDLEEVLKILEQHNWDSTRTSADYLRKFLTTSKYHDERIAFEQSLQHIFPGDAEWLYRFAEAFVEAGKYERVPSLLKQVAILDAKLEPSCKALLAKIPSDTPTTDNQNILGLNEAVIIDSDNAVQTAMINCCKDLGIDSIKVFQNGEDAWSYMEQHDVGLVISEWRVPKLATPLLIQRLRSKGKSMPLMVLSSLVRSQDMPLVREMGVACVIEKPAEKDKIIRNVIWTIQQERMPTEALTMEIKLRLLLQNKRLSDAETLMQRFLADQTISPSRKLAMQAEFAFAGDQFEKARDLAMRTLKKNPDSLVALNILGKAFLVLRNFEAALKCFQKAQSLSPSNLERLCLIAETQADMGDTEAATATISKARDLDPESSVVEEGAAKVAITSGSSTLAKEILGGMDSIGGVISYMNNKAVAHARCGHTDEGIKLYEQTLSAVPDDMPHIKDVVTYNLALALTKKGDLPRACAELQKVGSENEKLQLKARSLQQRVAKAMRAGTTPALQQSDEQIIQTSSDEQLEKSEDATTLFTAMMELAPGDHCCYRIYESSLPSPQTLDAMLRTPAKFMRRAAIQRGSVNDAS